MKIIKKKNVLIIDGEDTTTVDITADKRIIDLEGFEEGIDIELVNFKFVGDTKLVRVIK